jgi:hypothetical protein
MAPQTFKNESIRIRRYMKLIIHLNPISESQASAHYRAYDDLGNYGYWHISCETCLLDLAQDIERRQAVRSRDISTTRFYEADY